MSIDQHDRWAMEAAGLKPPMNPDAVGDKDQWLVVSSDRNRVIEGWPTLGMADRACMVLADHAKACGYDATYRTVPRPEVER